MDSSMKPQGFETFYLAKKFAGESRARRIRETVRFRDESVKFLKCFGVKPKGSSRNLDAERATRKVVHTARGSVDKSFSKMERFRLKPEGARTAKIRKL